MRICCGLIALLALAACGDGNLGSGLGGGVQVFERTRFDRPDGFELGTKALSGKWIIDCSATVSAYPDMNGNTCVLKNWGGQKMATLGPVAAKRGLRIVLSSDPRGSRITTIGSSDYLETPYLLTCGSLKFPTEEGAPLKPISGPAVYAVAEFLKSEQCTLGFQTREGEHAYDVNIPTEGFSSASKFAEQWILASHKP